MVTSVLLQAPAALPHMEKPWYPLDGMVREAQILSAHRHQENISADNGKLIYKIRAKY